MDPVDDNSQDIRGDKSQDVRGEKPSFRGRSNRRGHNTRHSESREEKLENLVNIKVELSTETGHRNCVLDESTKIPGKNPYINFLKSFKIMNHCLADLKYIPDQHRKPRGRGSFRGRGRGRGGYRGRKEMSNRSTSEIPLNTSAQIPETTTDEYPENAEGEDFVDSSENYDDSGYVEPDLSHQEEPKTVFDASSLETMTITSQKGQDGDVQRAVEVTASNENLEQVPTN